ncbi:MAG: SIS domain-containing protein [Opitutales bacterium]|nr:SIS domain-containing protein [Opitutales bacterium]
MNKSYFNLYTHSLSKAISETEVNTFQGRKLTTPLGFDELCALSKEVQKNEGQQFIVGNGASAGIANHMALDWTKNGKVKTHSFANAPMLTALGNDLGFDDAFSSVLDWYGSTNDLLISISSSGNSPNILNAIKMARKKGMQVVTFSGLKPDNQSRGLGDLNFYIKAKTYGIVECAHQALMHCWLDQFMGIEEWEIDAHQNMRQTPLEV